MRKNAIKIFFSGLNYGLHHFKFDLENSFFEQIEHSLIKKGKASVYVDFTKMSALMQLHFKFNGAVQIECDRCLGEVFIPLKGQDELIVKLSTEDFTDNPNIIAIAPSDSELDLTHFIYEMIALQLPIKSIPCEILNDFSVCDSNMLKKLEQLIPHSENTKNEETENSIWKELNKFKNLN